MTFDAQQFLSQALPALNFADKGEMNFVTGQALIEPYNYGDGSEGVRITSSTYHGNVSCLVEVEKMPKEPFLVNAQDFMRLLAAVSGTINGSFHENIGIDGKSHHFVTFSTPTSKFVFPVGDASTFPSAISYKNDDAVWEMKAQEFLDVLATLSPFCKQGDFRPQMSGIMFCDSIAFTTDADSGNICAKCALDTATNGFFVIPPSAVKHIDAALKACNTTDGVSVFVDKNANIGVSCPSAEFNINALTDKPHNWHDTHIAAWENAPASVFDMDATDLKTVMSQCLLLSPKWVTLTPDEGEIIVTAANDALDLPGTGKTAECHLPANIVSLEEQIPTSFHFSAGRLLQAASRMNGKVTAKYTTKNVLVLQDSLLTVFIMAVDIKRPEIIKKP